MATTQLTDAQATPQLAGGWRVVPDRSHVGFSTRLLFGLIPVRGRYAGYDGNLQIHADGQTSGGLRVDAATITTGIKKRDAHLRSVDYFHVEAHPHFTFELISMTPGTDGEMSMVGTLRIRENDLPLAVPVIVTQTSPDEVRLEADFEVDHSASALGWKRVPSSVRVRVAMTLEREW